jgi:hypothetical protein
MPDTFVTLSKSAKKLPAQNAKKDKKKDPPKMGGYPAPEALFPDQEWG